MANVPSRTLLTLLLLPLLAAPLRAQPSPASVTVLTRADFARLHYYSLSDVLDQAVGLDVERTGYRGTISRARLRGLPQTQSLIIAIDGRPLTHAYDSAVDISPIPLNMIERIEITRGGAPLSYGPSAAGVVNVITARPEQKKWAVDLETNVGRDGVRQHNGRFFDRFWLGDATYIAGLQDSGGFTFNEESERQNHFANLTRSFKKGGYIGVEYSFIGGEVGTPNGSILPISEWNGEDERVPISQYGIYKQEIQTARVLAASPLIAGGTFYSDFTQSFNEQKLLTQPNDGISLDDRDNGSSEGRLRWEHKYLTVGVEGNDFKRRMPNLPRRNATQSGAFAQTWFHLGAFEFSPSVRTDHHSVAGDGTSARFSTLFRPGDITALSASVQRGSRFPTFDELFPGNLPGPKLDPEKVTTVDVGLAFEGARSRIAATVFDTHIDDAIAFDSTGGAFANSGEDRSRGVELETSITTGKGAWKEVRLSGHYTVRNAERSEPGSSEFVEAPLSSKRLAFLRLAYRLPWKITMTNEMRYESEKFETSGRTGRRLPPFAIWNLRFTANILSSQVFLAAENLGGRRYAEAFGSTSAPAGAGLIPQPPATFWVGLSIRFLE